MKSNSLKATTGSALFCALFAVCLTIGSCGEDKSTEPKSPYEENTDPAIFTVSPVAIDKITDLEPLGAMNPSGHTIPTDHVYFYTSWTYGQQPIYPAEILPVYAPGSGVVTWILQGDGRDADAKIMLRMNKWVLYYLDHVVLDSAIKVGSIVTAGQIIGESRGIAIDLGVVNEQAALTGFVNPLRYGWQTLYTDSPYKYFSEPLRSQLYAMVRRNAVDKDGKIDYDVPGTLIGNWFHESVEVAESMMPPAWPKHLAFCPDSNEPEEMRISIGGTVSTPGKFKPSPTDPAFTDVTLQSGRVVYHLNYTEFGYFGIMLVQLLDSLHLKVEVFPNSTDLNQQFTDNAKVYSR
ncbi:MAG: hypothetical protein IPH59_05465 [bacterium]|nr:hypothetical protein [bacterium]